MEINIVCDDSKIQGLLKSIDAGFEDFSPFLKEIGKIQLAGADEAFKTRGANLGQPWAPLKLSTVKEKIRIGKNVDILQRTGRMRKSFRISKVTKNELEIENPVEYFKKHQIGIGKLPQRQMLGHSPAMIKRHQIAANQYVLNLIRK